MSTPPLDTDAPVGRMVAAALKIWLHRGVFDTEWHMYVSPELEEDAHKYRPNDHTPITVVNTFPPGFVYLIPVPITLD